MSLYDCIWYLPDQKDAALAHVRIPSAEERAARGVFGIGWGTNQPKPLSDESWAQYRLQAEQTGPRFDGTTQQEWRLLFGNIPGISRDPDILRGECNLVQIAPGLVGGTITEEARETDTWKQRAAATTRAEAEKRATIDTEAEQRSLDRLQALRDLWQTAAIRVGIRNAEKLTNEQLKNQFEFVRVSEEFPLPDEIKWIDAIVPADPVQITLENCGDWEDYLQSAYMSVVASPKMIKRK